LFQVDLGLRYEDAAFDSRTVNGLGTAFAVVRSYRNFFPNLTMTYLQVACGADGFDYSKDDGQR